MKKLFFVIVLTALAVGAANAQQSIGLRVAYGAELSYQRPLNDNRLELGLGLTSWGGGLNVVGTYQWVKPLKSNFSWYYGLGAGLGIWDKAFAISGLGQVGIEYNFPSIPLQLSLDWRPSLTFVFYEGGGSSHFFPQGVGLGVRYKF